MQFLTEVQKENTTEFNAWLGDAMLFSSKIHLFHLLQKNYNEHLILDELYKKIPSSIDSFVECYYSEIETPFINTISIEDPNYTIKKPDVTQSEICIFYIQNFKSKCLNLRKIVRIELQTHLDDIIQNLNETLYKLKMVK